MVTLVWCLYYPCLSTYCWSAVLARPRPQWAGRFFCAWTDPDTGIHYACGPNHNF